MAARVLEEVDEWIQKHARIQFAPPINGGWERWAQIDFNLQLNYMGIQTRLEDQVFKTGAIDDITVLPYKTNTEVFPGAIMELKVLNAPDSVNDYRNKLDSDRTKLINDSLLPGYEHYEKCSYGIAPAQRLIALLQKIYTTIQVTLQNLEKVMEDYLPSHKTQLVNSANGTPFAITFAYVQ